MIAYVDLSLLICIYFYWNQIQKAYNISEIILYDIMYSIKSISYTELSHLHFLHARSLFHVVTLFVYNYISTQTTVAP